MEIRRIGAVENDREYRSYLTESLSKILSDAQIYSWNSAEEFFHDKNSQGLDLVFADINLPGMNGIEMVRIMKQREPDLKALVLTVLNQEETIFRAMEAGAIGYILKGEAGELEDVVSIISSGGAIISPTIAFRIMQKFNKVKHLPETMELSIRETQCIELIVSGASTQRVASQMGIGIETVRAHVKNIYKKLQINSRIDLFRKAQELGII